MKILKIMGINTLWIILFSACSTNTPFEPPDNADNLANFTSIQTRIFDASCAVSGCHVGQNAAGGLNLAVGVSYNQLVEVQSVLYPALRRIDKGSSDESVLSLILDGSLNPRMPLGRAPLSASVIDSVKKWIDEGALNN